MSSKVRDLFPHMCQLAGYSLDEELSAFEEVKNEPTVMCDPLDRINSLHKCQLENGDIICFHKDLAEPNPAVKHPQVPDYLNYIKNRQVVRFIKSDKRDEVIQP